MSTSLSIKGKTQGNESTTATVNYVNPNATNAQLVSLATALNDLTTNTIADITKISKESLMDSGKLSRNLFFSRTSNPPGTRIESKAIGDISTNTQEPTQLYIGGDFTGVTAADVNIKLTLSENISESIFALFEPASGDGFLPTVQLVRTQYEETPTGTATLTITTPETDIYEAASATLAITNS